MNDDKYKDKMDSTVDSLVDNIGLQENAFILIFLAHNDKKSKQNLIKKITDLLDGCFSECDAAKLDEIDDEIDELVNNVISIPGYNISKNTGGGRTTKTRMERDKERDRREIHRKDRTEDVDERDSKELKDLKISIRAIEVLGHIIKNEFATLEKQEVDNIFARGINNHLRITTHLFDIIESIGNDMKEESEKLNDMKEESEKPNDSKLKVEIQQAISYLYFIVSLSTVVRVTQALGSKRIIKSLNSFCNKKDIPVHFLINFYADVMYKNGNFNEANVKRKMEDKNFPKTCKNIMQALFRHYWEHNNMEHSMLLKKAAALKIEYGSLFGNKSKKNVNPLLKNVNKYKKGN